jgi:hypothetical protein
MKADFPALVIPSRTASWGVSERKFRTPTRFLFDPS